MHETWFHSHDRQGDTFVVWHGCLMLLLCIQRIPVISHGLQCGEGIIAAKKLNVTKYCLLNKINTCNIFSIVMIDKGIFLR
jgi:hypothetical protein